MKTVVEFLRNKGTDRLRYVGELARLDRVYGWNHQVIGPEVTPKQARQILDYWKPDGCIVNNDALPADFTKGIPTVYLHRDPKTLPRKAARSAIGLGHPLGTFAVHLCVPKSEERPIVFNSCRVDFSRVAL